MVLLLLSKVGRIQPPRAHLQRLQQLLLRGHRSGPHVKWACEEAQTTAQSALALQLVQLANVRE